MADVSVSQKHTFGHAAHFVNLSRHVGGGIQEPPAPIGRNQGHGRHTPRQNGILPGSRAHGRMATKMGQAAILHATQHPQVVAVIGGRPTLNLDGLGGAGPKEQEKEEKERPHGGRIAE